MPEQPYPPAAPGKGAETWLCAGCKHPIGVVCGGWLYSRHKDREVVARLPAVVRCACGKKNKREA